MKTYEWPLSPQQIEELAEAECATFDLFETLVCRTGQATEPFKVYGLLGSRIRKYFELYVRVLQKIGLASDFKLESLRYLLGEKIDREFEYDLKNLMVRKNVRDLLQGLLSAGTKIGIVTNSYYSHKQIAIICQKLDLVGHFDLVISSEVGFTKREGLLKKSNFVSSSPHWHFGDDLKEDAAVSDDIFVQIKKIQAQIPAVKDKVFLFPKYHKKNQKIFSTHTYVATQYESEVSPWFWFGVFFSGPLSLVIGQNLYIIAEKIDARHIYLLARDGYLPFRYLQGRTELRPTYLPYSREISISDDDIKRLTSMIQDESGRSKKLIFDLGWQGKSAARLIDGLDDNSLLVLFGRWPWHKKTENYSIGFGSIKTIVGALRVRKCPEIFELALSAPHDSVEELPNVLADWSSSLNLESSGTRSEIARGAMAFFESWDIRHMGETTTQAGLRSILELVANPQLNFLRLASKEEHMYQGRSFSLVGSRSDSITFWIKGSWRFQKALQIPLHIRLRNAGKEWLRRLPFAK